MKTCPFSPFERFGIVTFALMSSLAVGILQADDGTPKAFPANRYDKMASHSPFTPPTAPVAPTPTPPPPAKTNFADKLTAVSLMNMGGVYMVKVNDPDSQKHVMLYSDGPTEGSDYQLASVKWNSESDKNEAPVITLRRGSEFGVVRYEPGNAAPGGSAGGPAMPGAPRPGIMPANTINRPFIPPAIPGTGAPAVNAPINSAIRRAPIRGPQPPPATGGRPIVLPGNATSVPAGVKPGVNTDDDDDDD